MIFAIVAGAIVAGAVVAAGAFCKVGASVLGAAASVVLAGSASATGAAASWITYCSHNASSISETLLIAAITSSFVFSDINIRLKERSNFSSSISCTLGEDTIISPSHYFFTITKVNIIIIQTILYILCKSCHRFL